MYETSLVECDLCSYKWVAVRPKDTDKLECPNCNNIVHYENIKLLNNE
jgi:DNA-directed RNA polymerase subunit RPC12/RpoP